MKTLVVEDDFVSRRLMQSILLTQGECDVAVNGEEALEAFRTAHEAGKPYDLICLDIMMPGMDGKEVLRRVRDLEAERGVSGLRGVKVIMTTALDDFDTIMESFRGQCEAYLVKPIGKGKLLEQVQALGLGS